MYPCWQRACVESVLRVMPLTRSLADAFGVVTICLVSLLILVGLLCILHSFYLQSRIRSQGFMQLSYFSGPWIIRITFILFSIWWGFGEIIRLSLLRREGRILNALDLKWQETVCKCYIVSNLGFAEPCLFLILVFLLRAPLQKMESGTLNRKWNRKTAGYVLLYCLPVFVLQLVVILIGPRLDKDGTISYKSEGKLPHYFTSSAAASKTKEFDYVALCTYPLLSTLLLGLFATVLTAYLFWLGRRIINTVINKGLQKRVYTLIFSVSGFLPLRVVLLGLSVLSRPEHFLFETLAFLAFLALLSCAGVCICMLVYCPVADSLALGNLRPDLEALRTRMNDDDDSTDTTISLVDALNQSQVVGTARNSDASSTKRGSISFRTSEKDEAPTGTFVELSLFSPTRHETPPGSSRLLGWPMRPTTSTNLFLGAHGENQFCG